MVAGLVSFASPCILPLVPGYLGYVGGMGREVSRRRLMLGVGLFIAGFTVVFVAYGALFGALGSWLVQRQDLMIRVFGVLVVLMGLVFVGQVGPLQRVVRPSWTPRVGTVGAPVLGVVFGLGWTPCLGPTLVAISALSVDAGTAGRGALLALAYCFGLGVPFGLVAWGFGWAKRSTTFLREHLRAINIAGGAVLVLIGLAMVTGLWTVLMTTMQGWVGGFVTPI
ncbi:cytochrome c biogenesis protein CcdA [Cellulosimicrobium sp. BIT-GX5]|uniref:Cytochrome c biogenesis protein CcdA n=2 Tax=Cellulosimicrobium TaxID=157920 RepID=A0A6N7ZLL8_9MICO|nr:MULTISPECIES: cytochrome c biogenesis protein CcdA [Cellulosimicrobium]MTG90240.1 cytochrome c biogenesis protein CcdA [Cellulosimicrobium composti]QUC02009.1 cytochrome c biogenesis protein CcdA [Cellulosimicrobium cellulans]